MTTKRLQIIAVIVFTFGIVVALLQVDAQDTPGDVPMVTPSPVIFPPPQFGHPELICPYFQNVQAGYSWHDITIGVSTQADLERFLRQFGEYELVFPDEGVLANSIGYRWRQSSARGRTQQAPLSLDICIQDGHIVVLDMTWFYQPAFYINDVVALHGAPDVVTWSLVENNRTVFWFEIGVAANVFVQRGDAASFGLITRMIYFPPQSSDGYENRWPFNLTRTEPFHPIDPSIPSEQNPFDFDMMIATITAEPSRTPTPTFTPMPVSTSTP